MVSTISLQSAAQIRLAIIRKRVQNGQFRLQKEYARNKTINKYHAISE